MEIGIKLKNARTKSGLTQEKVAEEIGVSRQSVSNWENGRSYPDIVSVIKLSDLYSVSLDELLKEDKNMIRHLSESTDAVASNKRLIKWLTIAAYWVCWGLAFLIFWINPERSWNAHYPIVGIVMAAITALFGVSKDMGRMKWLYVPITMIMFSVYGMLTVYLDWYLDELWRQNLHIQPPEQPRQFDFFCLLDKFIFDGGSRPALIWGLCCSLVGLFVGTFIRYAFIIRNYKREETEKPSLTENSDPETIK